MGRSVCVVVVLMGAVAAAHGADGLLRNGDFGSAPPVGGVPGWTVSEAGRQFFRVDDADGHAASGVLRFQAVEGATGGPVTQTIACEPNTDYLLTAALKYTGAAAPVVQVWAAGQDRPLAEIAATTSAWKLYTVRFVSGAATSLEVRLHGQRQTARGGALIAGEAAFDDLQVYPLSEVPADLRPAEAFAPPGPNVALGRPYALKPAPSYGLCLDPGDATQLTDGEYTVGYFWAQKTTVGWTNASPVAITIDLGEITPIMGLSYNTAAGVASVSWPSSILIMVSDDGRTWRLAGDLMDLATGEGLPSASVYSVHRFATDALRTRGRYVSLFVEATPYLFADEIEVYRGPDELLTQEPSGVAVDDPAALAASLRVRSVVGLRLRTDLAALRQAIGEAPLKPSVRDELLLRAMQLARRIEALPETMPANLTTIHPMHEVQAAIFAAYSALHRARGFSGLVAWRAGRWDPLGPTEAPSRPPSRPPALSIEIMRGETRADAFCLTNATDETLAVTVRVTGLPGGPDPEYLTVREALTTDSREMTPITAALPEARRGATGYKLTLPAGMTRQVWLEFNPQDLPAGRYDSQVLVRSRAGRTVLPISLQVHDLDFPQRPSVSVGGWDYLNGSGAYEAGPGNIPALIAHLRSRYVDTPWATSAVQPSSPVFDAEGTLVSGDFAAWDEWVGKWPGARQYAVFLATGAEFAGEPMGTPRFRRMVGSWITAWVAHLRAQGLRPEQLVLLVFDEPTEPTGAEIIAAWAQAVKAAQPGVTIFTDPCFPDPASAPPAMFAASDILCPNLVMWVDHREAFEAFYLPQQEKGKTLWFYSCSGPGKLLDPIYYHRAQFWWAARYGATGSFYWAFGDEGGAEGFRGYTQRGTHFSPLFVNADSVVAGKHMEAIREGAEDYEYLAMLRARVAELEGSQHRGPALDRAQALLRDLPVQVTEQLTTARTPWHVTEGKDRELMDRARLQVLRSLDELSRL